MGGVIGADWVPSALDFNGDWQEPAYGIQDLDVPDLRLDLRRGRWRAGRRHRPGTKWEDVPINWTCPECGARKEDFEMVAI
jgi:hypothetical protein